MQHFLSFYVSSFCFRLRSASCLPLLVGFCFHKYFRRCNTFAYLIKLKYFVCTMHTGNSRRNVLKQGIASQSLSFMICNRRFRLKSTFFFFHTHTLSLSPLSQPVSFQTALFSSKIHFLYIENGGNFFLQRYTFYKPEVGINCLCGSFQTVWVFFFPFFLFAFYVQMQHGFVAFEC